MLLIHWTYQTGDNVANKVEIIVPSEYLVILSEINPILTWSANCVLAYTNVANQGAKFAVTEAKLYDPVVILSTQENAELLQKIKSGLKRIINWNRYLSKPQLLAENQNFNHLVKTSK